MRATKAIGLLLLSLLFVAADADANKKDQDAMQGDWHCEKFVRDGQAASDDEAQALFRHVKGDSFATFRFRKKGSAGKFTLDASKSPRQIDFVFEMPKGLQMKGIYKIEGDKLTLCYAGPKGERPAAFESKEESGVTLTVWVREKK
jgi:uncharacterized protein (TIGR03067 family)